MNQNKEIYVYLLDEGTDVWRPDQAEKISNHLFRIVSKNPEEEKWQFSIGDIVKCEYRMLADSNSKKCLVAVEKIDKDES